MHAMRLMLSLPALHSSGKLLILGGGRFEFTAYLSITCFYIKIELQLLLPLGQAHSHVILCTSMLDILSPCTACMLCHTGNGNEHHQGEPACSCLSVCAAFAHREANSPGTQCNSYQSFPLVMPGKALPGMYDA